MPENKGRLDLQIAASRANERDRTMRMDTRPGYAVYRRRPVHHVDLLDRLVSIVTAAQPIGDRYRAVTAEQWSYSQCAVGVVYAAIRLLPARSKVDRPVRGAVVCSSTNSITIGTTRPRGVNGFCADCSAIGRCRFRSCIPVCVSFVKVTRCMSIEYLPTIFDSIR